MRRKRQRISVVLTVLALGLVVGWVAGDKPEAVTVEAMAHVQVETADQVAEEVEATAVHHVLEPGSAFRMPYFSFGTMLPRVPSTSSP